MWLFILSSINTHLGRIKYDGEWGICLYVVHIICGLTFAYIDRVLEEWMWYTNPILILAIMHQYITNNISTFLTGKKFQMQVKKCFNGTLLF